MMNIKIRKLHPQAMTPVYSTSGAGCFDLQTVDHNTVFPGGSTIFNTGLAIEVPEGYVMMIYSRSGHGFTHGLRLSNCVGVIDSDYRGEEIGRAHV
jgi:dUTP pyrophosphatase